LVSPRDGHQLDQSQISRILSSKYDFLDNLDPKKDKAKAQLQKDIVGDWPELKRPYMIGKKKLCRRRKQLLRRYS